MARKKNPSIILAAVAISSIAAASYKFYEYYLENKKITGKQYTNKSIALTLSHSILNSQLPLDDIILNSENVTFILPPNLSLDDLEVSNIQEMIKNYKLLNCTNFQGYFNIIKNLKPDMLLVCSEDLGILDLIPKDLGRFVDEIVDVEQSSDDVEKKVLPIFVR